MRAKAAIAAVGGALAIPASAQAHVSLHPNVWPAGSFPTAAVRVPNEMDNATVTKVDMQIPPGILSASYGPVPGWQVQVKTRKLAKPVQTDDGQITEEPIEITWTAQDKQAQIPVGAFGTFPIAISVPDTPGKTLSFKTLQTYSNGKTVSWIGPASADTPAPTVNVAAKSAPFADLSGDAGPPAGATGAAPAAPAKPTSSATSSDSASKGLGIAALVVGALGLIAGLTALVLARRKRVAA